MNMNSGFYSWIISADISVLLKFNGYGYRPLAPCARSTVVHDYEHLQYLRFEALQQHTTRKYIEHYGVVVNRT
jgi:hypothetical protein